MNATRSVLVITLKPSWCGQVCSEVGTRYHTFCIATFLEGLDYIKTWLRSHRCAIATRRFALLVKSLQWNRKIHRRNSCRRMLTLCKLFSAIFFLFGRSHTSFL